MTECGCESTTHDHLAAERREAERKLAAALRYNDSDEVLIRTALKALDDSATEPVLAARLRATGVCTAREATWIAAKLLERVS